MGETILMANNRVNSDSQKWRRFALPLLAAGYAERWETQPDNRCRQAGDTETKRVKP